MANALIRVLTVTEKRILEAAAAGPVGFIETNRLTRKDNGTYTPTEQQVTFLMQEGLLQPATSASGTPIALKLSLSDLGEKVLHNYATGKLKPVDDIAHIEEVPADPTATVPAKIAPPPLKTTRKYTKQNA